MRNSSSGSGILGCLFMLLCMVGMLFLVLKLAQIGLPAIWSWWFVLMPFYIIPVGFVLFLIAIFGGAWILDQFGKFATWWRYRERRARIKKNDAEIAARVKKNEILLNAAEKRLREEGYISPKKEDPPGYRNG